MYKRNDVRLIRILSSENGTYMENFLILQEKTGIQACLPGPEYDFAILA